MARVQSVLVLVQSLPLLITINALGALNDLFIASVVLVVCAVFLLAAAALGLRSPALRTAMAASHRSDRRRSPHPGPLVVVGVLRRGFSSGAVTGPTPARV